MVCPAKPPRVDTGGPSFNLISSCKKNPVPNFALAAQFLQVREANAVTHQMSGVDQEYRNMVKGPDRKVWERLLANKLGKSAQGIRTVKRTNTVIFIPKTKVPNYKNVTYGKIVCVLKPEKEDKERTRLTVEGNLLGFTGNISAPTASVATKKCVLNSVVSTPGARCLLDNIKSFYLNNILPDPEFMRIQLKITPQEIIDAYNLITLVDNQGCIYMCIEKGVYGIKQAVIIASQGLVKHMDPFGYHPVQHTPGLWVHDKINIIFSLMVDEFCVRYSSMEDCNQFLNALRAKYLITVDKEARFYIGINIDWDYVHRTVILSMPNYVHKYLHIFQHILRCGKSAPHISVPQSNMDRTSNMRTLWIQRNTSPTKKPTSFNKLVALSYIIPSVSTTLFFPP